MSIFFEIVEMAVECVGWLVDGADDEKTKKGEEARRDRESKPVGLGERAPGSRMKNGDDAESQNEGER
jgi:hypothetical protein